VTEPEEAIHRALSATLLAGRLPPGTQLKEVSLAALFGVSRERVRKVLHRLGHERLLELQPNRGAFVASPTLADAREIYEARRILEGGIVARLAGRLTAVQRKSLDAHAKRERAALKQRDRALLIRLSGEFHVLLADCAGSPFVMRQLQELVSRTSMLVAFFEPASASSCACEEHAEVIEALTSGDAARSVKAMHAHLSMIETRLVIRDPPKADLDADAVLRRAWRAANEKGGRRGKVHSRL
jgi:DNA-binding GntR family transcriptional regulator